MNSMISISHGLITGGTFINNNQPSIKGGFERLQEAVAPTAFHNSGAQFDPPKCHPNTRVAVLREISDWILGLTQENVESFIMWLSGPAGAGKSAIANSAIAQCEVHNLLAAFFFNKSDPSRNHIRSFVPTLAYQIYCNFPPVQSHISAIIEKDPLIFTRSFSHQFTSLIAEPLHQFYTNTPLSFSEARRVIVVDGLDECIDREAQVHVIKTLASAIKKFRLPVIVFIASRPEHDIKLMFDSKPMRGIHTRIFLDNSYFPYRDIKLYLHDSFKDIKETHPLMKYVSDSWPSEDIVEILVRKSSGQFIYAATVIKFIKSTRHRPDHRLEIVLNLRPPQRELPFAELDALYSHILSSAEDVPTILHVLSFMEAYVDAPMPTSHVEYILGFDAGAIFNLFCDIASVVAILPDLDTWSTLHASFLEFLWDPLRSKEFYLDSPSLTGVTMFALCCLRSLEQTSDMESSPELHESVTSALSNILFVFTTLMAQSPDHKVPVELINAVSNFSISGHIARAWKQEQPYEVVVGFIRYLFPQLLQASTYMAGDMYDRRLQELDEILMTQMPFYYSDLRLTLHLALICHDGTHQLFQEKHTLCRGFSILWHPLLQLTDVKQDPLCSQDFHPELGMRGYLDTDGRQYAGLLRNFLRDPSRSKQYTLGVEMLTKAALCCLVYLCLNEESVETLSFIRDHDSRGQNDFGSVVGESGTIEIHQEDENDDVFDLSERIQHHYMIPRTPKWDNLATYYLALGYFIYFLPRSGRYNPLIQRCKNYIFNPMSMNFPIRRQRASDAIQRYLERVVDTTVELQGA